MLEYAARRPVIAGRPASPNALLLIVGAHIALIAAVMSVKMDLPDRIARERLVVDLLPAEPKPVERERRPEPRPLPQPSLSQPPRIVPTPSGDLQIATSLPQLPQIADLLGPEPRPTADPTPRPVPAAVAARLLTPDTELKPPYPHSKLASEEQAVLRLRLTIDDRGRVIAVAPVTRADPAFLDAARRHILDHWRYRPASEGGRAVESTAIVTLHFQLDG